MADAAVLKTVGGNPVRVRVPVSALILNSEAPTLLTGASPVPRARGASAPVRWPQQGFSRFRRGQKRFWGM